MQLMHDAGYDAGETVKIWGNLLIERKARTDETGIGDMPLFASHPAPEERQETLAALAATLPGGEKYESAWRDETHPFRRGWLNDEVKRGRYDESIALLTRMLRDAGPDADILYARGEAYRLRAKQGDLDAALADLGAAAATGAEPPETHRALGIIHRARGNAVEAVASFRRYTSAAGEAPDASMIQSYVEELQK
jgi:tetratricopeptide (TPR) repeat protein